MIVRTTSIRSSGLHLMLSSSNWLIWEFVIAPRGSRQGLGSATATLIWIFASLLGIFRIFVIFVSISAWAWCLLLPLRLLSTTSLPLIFLNHLFIGASKFFNSTCLFLSWVKIAATFFLLAPIRIQRIQLCHTPASQLFHRIFIDIWYINDFLPANTILLKPLPRLIRRSLIMLVELAIWKQSSSYCDNICWSVFLVSFHDSRLRSFIQWLWNDEASPEIGMGFETNRRIGRHVPIQEAFAIAIWFRHTKSTRLTILRLVPVKHPILWITYMPYTLHWFKTCMHWVSLPSRLQRASCILAERHVESAIR